MAIVVVLLLILFHSDGTCGVRWRSNGRKRAYWQSRETVDSQRRSDSAVPITTPFAPAVTDRRIHAHISPDFSRKAWSSLALRGGSMRRGDDADIGQDTCPAGVDVNGEAGDGEGLDENLYSRQLYVMGKSAMAKIRKADVLISGMSGLGAEVAKNVILAGVRSVTLHDDRPSTAEDLSSQFCIDEEAGMKKGTPRARASVDYLRELNPYVDVRLLEGPLTEEIIEGGGYTAVLLVDESVGFQLQMNEACRKAGACFLAASSRGVFASLFCDFGDRFVVEDRDGEEPLVCLLGSLMREEGDPVERWVVEAVDGERHHFQAEDVIRLVDLRDAEGCLVDGLAKEEFTVETVINTKRFSITGMACCMRGDSGGVLRRVAGGRAVQVKKPSTVSFLPFKEALRPENILGLILPTDFGKLEPARQMTIHACFLCLDDFRRRHGGRLPIPGSAQDAEAFLSLVKTSPFVSCGEKGERGIEVDEGIVEAFSRTCAGGLSPVSGFYGGFVAQEVLKGCTRLFTPARQFVYYDCVEVLPKPLPTL